MPGGAEWSMVTLAVNVPVEEVTVSVCAPIGVDALSTALICVGETKNIPAAAPPTATLAPPRIAGGFNALGVTAMPLARLAPKIVIMLPGASDVLLTRDAALTTRVTCAVAVAASAPAKTIIGKIFLRMSGNLCIVPPYRVVPSEA